MPAIQEIYDKTIEGYTVDNDWLYYMDKDEVTKHYIPYVYREATLSFYQDFKELVAKTDLNAKIVWNDERCAFTIFDTTFILACIESINPYARMYENRNNYKAYGSCITPSIFYDYQQHCQCYLSGSYNQYSQTKQNILNNKYMVTEILSAGMVNRFYNHNQYIKDEVMDINNNGIMSGINGYLLQYNNGYQLHTKRKSSIRVENYSETYNISSGGSNFKYGIVIHYNENFLHIAYKPAYEFNLNGMSYYLNDKLPLIFICQGKNKLTNDDVLYITADPNSTIKTMMKYVSNINMNVMFNKACVNQNFLMPIYNSWAPLGVHHYVFTDETNGNMYGYPSNSDAATGFVKYYDALYNSEILSVTHNLYTPSTKEHLDPYNVNPYFVFDLLPGHEKFVSSFIGKEGSQIYLQKLQTYLGFVEFDNIYNVQESEDLYYQDAYFTINGETYYKPSNNFIGLQKHKNNSPVFLLKV